MSFPRPRGLGRLAALGLAASLVLTGCAAGGSGTGSGGESAAPVSGGTLTFGRVASVTSFDLNNQITANNAFAIDKVFEPLVAIDTTGAIQPWLASAYTISDDGLVYTFTLRDGLTFSDGTTVTPADVVFSLNRHLQVGGPLPLTAPITDIAAGDGNSVVITLSTPYTPFLSELSGFSNGIFPANFGGRTEEEFFQAPIGTGPFVVSKWDPAGDLTFTANKHYWQEGKPYLDGLVYKLVPDDAQLLQQVEAGQIDAIDEVPAANVADLSANDSVTVVTEGAWEIEQAFFNTQEVHFADVNVRRAVAHALDREGITTATTFGTAQVANALIPPTIEYSANDEGYALDHDLDAAKKALAASAYPNGFEATLLIANGNSQRAQEAQIVQAALAEIGITIDIESIDIAAFRQRFFAYDFDLMLNSGQSDAPDPDGLVTFQADPDGFSKSYWTHYTNPQVTELMNKGRVTPEGDDRKAIYLEIQKILADEVPYIPLFYPSNIKATTSKVQGLTVLPTGSIRFQDTWIQP